MTLQVTLRASSLELSLHVEGYEFPQFVTGVDANQLLCHVELHVERLGSFHASHRLTVLTSEIERFRDELRALEREGAGQATLEQSAQELSLTIRLNAGRGTLEGFLADGAAGRLGFEMVEIDRSFIHHALKEIEETVGAFPARGTLQLD